MKLRNFVSTTFLVALLTVVLFVGVWQIKPVQATESTFGKTNVGGSSDGTGGQIHLVCKFTSPSDFGSITKISSYFCADSGTISAIATLYADSGGEPTTRLAESSEVTDIGTSPSWVNFTISYAGSPSTVYWLGVHTSEYMHHYYDVGSANQFNWENANAYPTNTDPYDVENGHYIARNMSIYAVYTASTGISASSIAKDTTIAGQLCNFSAFWTSVSGNCDFYIFGTNNSGAWVNDTATAFSPPASTGWSNASKTLNSTVGVRVEWCVWANNSVGTWGNMTLQYFTTTNQLGVTNVGRSTSLASTSCTFYAYWTTATGTLDFYVFGTNNTGAWVNDTALDFSGTPIAEWSNVTKTLNATSGFVVQWRIWANNTNDVWGDTGLQQFTLTTWASEKYTVHAVSGYREDIQVAIDDVRANGDNAPEREGVVIVPYGAWTLDNAGGIGGSTSLYAIGTIYWQVKSYGGIDIVGEGMYETNLTLLPNSATYSGVTMIFVDGSNQKPFRISGISFRGRTGVTASATGDTAVFLDSSKDFRVDHCSFDYMGSSGVAVTCSLHASTAQGVVDHCNFTRMYKPDAETAGTGYGYGVGVERNYEKYWGIQDKLWDDYGNPEDFFGSYRNVTYVENCNFQGCRHAVMTYAVGTYVARFNTFTEMWVPYGSGHCDMHGAYPDNTYGGRYCEIYNNTFYNPPGGNIYGDDSAAHASRHRGGAGLLYNNYILNYTYAFGITTEDGNDANPKNKVNQIYAWDNTLINTTKWDLTENYDNRILGTHYFDTAPTFSYVPYEYPHPLTQTEEGLIVLLVYPNDTVYYTPTISVQVSAQGGTIDQIWWNCKNGTDWIYGSNQTYYGPTSMEYFVNGTSYTFYAWANNTFFVEAEKTFDFEVEIPTITLTITSPTCQRYLSGTISVELSALGGTIDQIWFNIKNGTDWIYVSNQTYTVSVDKMGFTIGSSYTFYAWANNTDGNSDEAIVMFTVEILAFTTEWGGYWGRWWGYP